MSDDQRSADEQARDKATRKLSDPHATVNLSAADLAALRDAEQQAQTKPADVNATRKLDNPYATVSLSPAEAAALRDAANPAASDKGTRKLDNPYATVMLSADQVANLRGGAVADLEAEISQPPAASYAPPTAPTAPAFSGRYDNNKADGLYRCAGCGNVLFDSDDKYDSGSGWPSFTKPVEADRVSNYSDVSHGMTRVEARCTRCDGHLGHVFPDGPPPTGQRYCMNSVSLDFRARENGDG